VTPVRAIPPAASGSRRCDDFRWKYRSWSSGGVRSGKNTGETLATVTASPAWGRCASTGLLKSPTRLIDADFATSIGSKRNNAEGGSGTRRAPQSSTFKSLTGIAT